MTSRLRPIFRRIHLWPGLSLGLIFVVLGLSGAALVFYIEIDEALHPEIQWAKNDPAPDWNSSV